MSTLALLQYNYSDTNAIVLYSNPSTQVQDALNYLLNVRVPFVNALPERPVGYYCLQEKDIYKVYSCYVDPDGIVIQDLAYCLQYIALPVG